MATALSSLRSLVNIRLGKQYNNDAEGQSLLDLWINMAGRYCWELEWLGFNESTLETGDEGFPTISSDEFTLPTTFISLINLKRSTGSGSGNFEDDIAFAQYGRTIKILDTGLTPTKMTGHSFWTNLTATTDTMSAYIPDYLVVELAAYFAKGETRQMNDNSPMQINSAFKLVQDWARKFSIRREGTSTPYGKDEQRLSLRNGIYTSGKLSEKSDIDSVPYTVGQ